MDAINTVGKVSRGFCDSNRYASHKIRLSDFCRRPAMIVTVVDKPRCQAGRSKTWEGRTGRL